jgi:hypothetical protein
MKMISRRPISEPEVVVSGRRFGLALLAGMGSAAGVGIVVYYCLIGTMGKTIGSALPQIVTFAVYATLAAVLCYFFRPPSRPPIALRFTGAQNLVFAIGATITLFAVCALAYALLGLFFGGFQHLFEQLTAVATDAKRLQGQGSSAWESRLFADVCLFPFLRKSSFVGSSSPG